jgi:RNase H-like domain found in reverse transcriptase
MKMNASESIYTNILSQQWKNKWHLIIYFSRKFSNSKLNYFIYNKKLMTIVMNFKQWRHYLKNVFKIKVWSNHANFKQFMSQTMLNSHQACWFIQLTSYNFIIQYCWDILNSADESFQRLNYMTKQNKKCHENVEKLHEISFKQFWLMFTQNNDSSSISVENKLTWQIDDLMSTLVNKLVTAVLEMNEQYSCCIWKTNLEIKCLI